MIAGYLKVGGIMRRRKLNRRQVILSPAWICSPWFKGPLSCHTRMVDPRVSLGDEKTF